MFNVHLEEYVESLFDKDIRHKTRCFKFKNAFLLSKVMKYIVSTSP